MPIGQANAVLVNADSAALANQPFRVFETENARKAGRRVGDVQDR